MKKQSSQERLRIVKLSIRHRKQNDVGSNSRRNRKNSNKLDVEINRWIDRKKRLGLNAFIADNCDVTLTLPEIMNFSDEYDATIRYVNAIRKFTTQNRTKLKSLYRLKQVNFDNLKAISTSAALVLTAELSRWDDFVMNQLVPRIDGWHEEVVRKFDQLGFFDLFQHKPELPTFRDVESTSGINLVRYIKGKCGDSSKTRELKAGLNDIIGDIPEKWMFLHSGLSEAITNVTHHAYPDQFKIKERDKCWYLTGSYSSDSRVLKVVFYDQGIGIPSSLPASGVWESVYSYLSVLPAVERKKDEVLLKAAVELDRTRTGEVDRGKGLQDLLEFARQMRKGYLSILSSRGLYKYSNESGNEKVKTERFKDPMRGTLIIWKVVLNE